MEIPLFALLLSLIFSAFFSGVEIAYLSTNKLALELAGKDGGIIGRILSKFAHNPSNFIGTALIGNNIALVIFGGLMAATLTGAFSELIPNELTMLIVQTIITTLFVLLFGEFVPKTLFRLKPLNILRFFSIPLNLFYILLLPAVLFIVWLSKVLLRYVFRLKFEESAPVFGKIDLQHYLELNMPEEKGDAEIDAELFENALYLTRVKVRECMVPRPEIEAVSINSTIDELRAQFIESGRSRLPVYFDTLDNILGYVHHFDLLTEPKTIGSIIRKMPVVPEAMTARDLLHLFKKETMNIAWVADEFGGTAGIVTMEDVLEELFGEIRDEHDEEDFVEKKLSDTEYVFSGRLEIDYLNEKYQLSFPEGEYETLAGYIVTHLENIPDKGQKVKVDRFVFDILSAENARLETVGLTLEGTD